MDTETGTLLTAQTITEEGDAGGPTNSFRKYSPSYCWTLLSLCS